MHADDDIDDGDDERAFDEGRSALGQFVLACNLPGCLMSGYHFEGECHTVEMLEDALAEQEER